ncbi:MAG: OmpA family protein [Nitrospiria bacterium]
MQLKNKLSVFIVQSLVISFFIGGCVTKGRFLNTVAEKEHLSEKLQSENSKNASLEKMKETLKDRLVETNRQKMLKENEQKQRIAALEKVRRVHLEEIKNLKTILKEKNDRTLELQDRLASEEKSKNRLLEVKRIAQEKEQKLQELQETARTRKALIDKLRSEINEGNVTISQMKGRLSVQIVNKILFPSGSTQITQQGKDVLKKVAKILKTLKKNTIRIEGHTDNVPIGHGLIHKFPSNWELSTARATEVVRHLENEAVNPENMVAVGMSQYKPITSNDSPEGRQMNRRIEIVLSQKGTNQM